MLYNPIKTWPSLPPALTGWDTAYAPWLECGHLNQKDSVFVFIVGGESKERNVSVNLIHALDYTKKVGARILGVIGRDGGYTGKVTDACLFIFTQSPNSGTCSTQIHVSWLCLINGNKLKGSNLNGNR